jgi:hypothetical protein
VWVKHLHIWSSRPDCGRRGLNEFRAGRPVVLTSARECALFLPVDGLSDDALAAFKQTCAPERRPYLVVTGRRVPSGWMAAGPWAGARRFSNAEAIFSLAAERRPERHLDVVRWGGPAAAIELAKLAPVAGAPGPPGGKTRTAIGGFL